MGIGDVDDGEVDCGHSLLSLTDEYFSMRLNTLR